MSMFCNQSVISFLLLKDFPVLVGMEAERGKKLLALGEAHVLAGDGRWERCPRFSASFQGAEWDIHYVHVSPAQRLVERKWLIHVWVDQNLE